MSMFRDYQSKPIIRKARKVSISDIITKCELLESTFILVVDGGENVTFKAYEDIKVGDYIVYLNDDDIYHCNAAVFADRNIVNG